MTDKTQPTAHAEITAPISADLRRMSGDEQPEALQQSAQPDALAEVSKEQYARMFNAACEALGQISDHLGIDSDIDPGAEPIIEAIDELRAAALQAAPPAPAAVAVPAASEVLDALNYVDDFVARCNGDDRGSCASVNLLRAALAAGPAQPFAPSFADGLLHSTVLHKLWEESEPTAQHGQPGALAWQLSVFAGKVAKAAAAPAQEHATQLAGQRQHPDDAAVDTLAAAMKAKLARQRAKGYGGWDTPECTQQRLSDMLRAHVEKGDPVDVANFCAFLDARGEGIAPAQAQEDAPALEAPAAPAGLDDSELEDLAHSANQECLSFGMSLDPFLRLAKTVRDRALAAAPQAPAAPAVDARAERDAAFEAVRNRLCGLQRYSFVLDDDGIVRRAQDRSGNWIEFDEAHELFDPVAVDAAIDAARAAQGGAA